jgi:hypothetical protein
MPLDKGIFFCHHVRTIMSDANFFELKGQIVKEITGLEKNSPEVHIVTNQTTYKLYHEQDCCESVFVENVIGDEKDILNEEIIFAEEDAGANDPDCYGDNYNDSHTWTKYVLKTKNASLEFWFLGESNGYYNENVSIEKI